MPKNKKRKLPNGFTLVELLVVMAILGILVTIIGSSFRNAQARGRDTQRKSDLKQISQSLELFYSDYGHYPSDEGGMIAACPFVGGTGTACSWGSGELTDNKTIYFKQIPADPVSSYEYYYRIVPGSNNKKFQIFARLENSQDQDCLGGDCLDSPVVYICGSGVCNFAITGTNTTATE